MDGDARPLLRRLPHNVDAEMALLGAILVNNRCMDRVSEFLRAEHFVLVEHARVFEACFRLIAGGQVADPVTLRDWARHDGTIPDGPAYLLRLADCAVPPITAAGYAQIITRDAHRRELIAIGEQITNRAYADGDPATVVAAATTEIEAVSASADPAGRFRVDDADDLLAGDIPPREWILGTILCRRYVTVMAAAGGAGKTSLAVAWALSLATGRPLSGDHVHHRARVLYVTAEDCRDELGRRLRAASMHHRVDAIGAGRMSVMCLTGSGVTLVRSIDAGDVIETDVADRIAAAVRRHRCDVLILDPLIKLSGAPENDNDAVDRVMRILVRIADDCNVAVLALHHARKGAASPGDTDSARGAGALIAAARVAVTLTGMSADEAAAMDVPEAERRRYVRLDAGKSNLAPIGAATAWYRLAGVPLGNGTDAYPSGDTVQAIERWTPPDAWDGITADIANRILDDIDAGMPDGERYSDAPRATDRAAWRVVQRHAAEKTDAQCRDVIRMWMRTGLLSVVSYNSPLRRASAYGLAVDASRRPS